MAENHHENPHMIISKIGIIGAGVSGIAATKQLSHHDPIVFEASDSIGGVWKTCAYSSTKLQSSREDYEFSDFPWPNREDPSYPTHVEIVDYLESYAKHFDVLKLIKFNSKVMELQFVGHHESTELAGNAGAYASPLPGHPVWQIAVQTNHSENLQMDYINTSHPKFLEQTKKFGVALPISKSKNGLETDKEPGSERSIESRTILSRQVNGIVADQGPRVVADIAKVTSTGITF